MTTPNVNICLKIPIVDVSPSLTSLIPFHYRLHQLSPLPHPSPSFSPPLPNLSFTQSSHLSLGLPLLLLYATLSASALFVNPSTSILVTCPTHFSRLLTSFLVGLSFTPTSSLSSHNSLCLFFSLPQFFTPTYSRKLAVSRVVFPSSS